jgi:hypothetical protein
MESLSCVRINISESVQIVIISDALVFLIFPSSGLYAVQVQGFLASRPSNITTPSSTQLSRLLPPPPSPTPQFPKSQTGFASIPSSVKVQPRNGNTGPLRLRHVTRGISRLNLASHPSTTRFMQMMGFQFTILQELPGHLKRADQLAQAMWLWKSHDHLRLQASPPRHLGNFIRAVTLYLPMRQKTLYVDVAVSILARQFSLSD